MNGGISVAFSLGRIGILEKTILPPEILTEIVELEFKDALSKIWDTLFSKEELAKGELYWVEALEKEEEMLRQVCEELMPDKDNKDFFKKWDNPSLLKDFLKSEGDLQEFVRFYFTLLDTANFLRIKTYGLQEEYYQDIEKSRIPSSLGRELFFDFPFEIKKFYLQFQDILTRGENYLAKFLIDKYLWEFWEEKRRTLLSENIIFWFYFTRRLNLKVLRFILGVLDYSLNRERARNLIKVIYG